MRQGPSFPGYLEGFLVICADFRSPRQGNTTLCIGTLAYDEPQAQGSLLLGRKCSV